MLAVRPIATLLTAFVLLVASPAAWAQNPDRPQGTYSAILDNMDFMINNYVGMLVRKYNLTDEQAEYTRELLHAKSQGFFQQHDQEIRNLLDEMFYVRTGGEIDQAGLQDWGRRVAPLFNEAKKVLVDGNDEWRQILTDEQRRIHDKDLQMMYESFETTGEQIQRIVSGEMTVDEFRNPPRLNARRNRATARNVQRDVPPRVVNPPPQVVTDPDPGEMQPDQPGTVTPEQRLAEESGDPRNPVANPGTRRVVSREPRTVTANPVPGHVAPVSPDRRITTTPPAGKSGPAFLSEWEKYVEGFISRYQLDEAQTTRARTILKDCQDQGERIMKARTPVIEQLDREAAELAKSDDKDKAKKAAAIAEKRKKLLEPIDRIFEGQLKPRLESLPTRAQRAAAEESKGGKKSDDKGDKKGKSDE